MVGQTISHNHIIDKLGEGDIWSLGVVPYEMVTGQSPRNQLI